MQFHEKTQEKPEKTFLSLYLRLILGTETAYNNKKEAINENNNKTRKILENGKNLTSTVTTFPNLIKKKPHVCM